MSTPTEKKFILNNTTGDIVEVDFQRKRVRYFSDPFGRESSGTPEWEYSVAQFVAKKDLLAALKPLFYPQNWTEFQVLLAEIPDIAT